VVIGEESDPELVTGVSCMVKKVRSKDIPEETSLRKAEELFSISLVAKIKAIDKGFLLDPSRLFATHLSCYSFN